MYKSLYTQPPGQGSPVPSVENVQNFELTRLTRALVRHIRQKRRAFKCVGNFSVRFADDLVDGLFPRGIDVSAFFDVDEELAEAHQRHVEELFGDLIKGVNLVLEKWEPLTERVQSSSV